MIRAITFDFWQTLYRDTPLLESERDVVRSRLIGETLRENNLSCEPDRLAAGLRDARSELDRVWRQERRPVPAVALAEIVLRQLGIAPQDRLVSDVARSLQDASLEVPPGHMPYAAQVLRRLAARYPVALICDTGFSPGRVLREMLRRDGLFECLRHLTFSDEIGSSKPSVRNFALTLEALQVDASEAVHIGDLVETDMVGAKAAGMRAVLYWSEGRQYDSVEPADAVVRDLREFEEVLEDW